MSEGVKIGLCISFRGKSWPVWKYETVPEGMRLAKSSDLYNGRPVLYKVRIGPNAGAYYTDFVRASTRDVLLDMIERGVEVYVK